MRIDVIATADEVKDQMVKGKLAVVIDVLRATSTIVTALSNGCKGVIPVCDVDQAKAKACELDPEQCLLGGERNAVIIEGFHHGNSPLEYTAERVQNKYVIITTTNGTRAIHHAKEAVDIVIASFLNGQAVVQYIHKNYLEDITIICAGTEGHFSLEDILCAGKIIYELKSLGNDISLNDLGIAAENLYKHNKDDMHQLLQGTFHYSRLISLNFEKDVEFCMQQDVFQLVPIFIDGIISITNIKAKNKLM
ncbi:MAG: 2-phosphosulfolactate phosphatase [Petroclostridium sp.]|jgi:2-phosphosulfolactate phosphatase|uniref:2-phosphosulfolactate phosphatase n=1 Tax=Petroclostridium xylanilyticum TaxID=1792311 RepID=UPI000B98B03A|nr:2-phosphosulfolactate phosphatase [Petroclostridium xylanilyticum]MBZ4646112.1 2-phosphosulfolactate phosphatase [Clostridia bacterium]MDK2810932.1 2-phosphosulfolactate phosphatase [Petroclostridium sp.]